LNIEIKGVLVNILIIFLGQLSILFINNIGSKGIKSNFIQKFSIFLSAGLSIILCMIFSYKIGDQYFYDLRYIPLLIGTLYGGCSVGIGLFLILNTFRIMLGGAGILMTIVTSFLLTSLALLIYKKFQSYTTFKKMLTLIALLHLTPITTAIILAMFNLPFLPLDEWVINLTVFTSGGIVLIYLTELIKRHIELNNQMIDFEKFVTISHLAASIAHEIRNPLTTVKGFLQLLYVKEFDEKRISYYKTIFSELERAENIIRDYLTFAKPKENKIEIINIKHEIEKTLTILHPLAKKNNIKITTNLEDLTTKGIVQYFVQCLINIIKNAIEAMPNGGEIHISAAKKKNSILLSIFDTGHGISKGQLNKLGQPFFSTKGENGTGLGLMVTYKIIKDMGGTIDVKSEINKGTEFNITLPLVIQPPNAQEEVASSQTNSP
jgi:two-component system, sporulation sensor kinase B